MLCFGQCSRKCFSSSGTFKLHCLHILSKGPFLGLSYLPVSIRICSTPNLNFAKAFLWTKERGLEMSHFSDEKSEIWLKVLSLGRFLHWLTSFCWSLTNKFALSSSVTVLTSKIFLVKTSVRLFLLRISLVSFDHVEKFDYSESWRSQRNGDP